MRILLDECVPWPMHRLLTEHECHTPQQEGWSGIKNGQLLSLAEQTFDLFITSDQNLQYQQSLRGRRIAILELSTNKLRRILAARALVQNAVWAIKPGESFFAWRFRDSVAGFSTNIMA
jgi:hypothetical protein